MPEKTHTHPQPARDDDADPSELAPDEAKDGDDGEIESSGQRAGMKHGEKPRKSKDREK